MTRILVTGALGQIGSELVGALRERHGAEAVIATDIRRDPPEPLSTGGPYEVLDVTDPAAVRDAVARHAVSRIVHLAAVLSARGETDPALCWRVNVEGARNVLDAARVAAIERVIIPSTIAVFGPEVSKDGTPQQSITRPRTIYGITKVTVELLGRYFGRKWNLDVRGLRYPGIISSFTAPGGGTTDYAVEMFYAAVRGEPYRCFVGEGTTLPFMYMPDAIRALIELANADRTNLRHPTSYNVAAMSFSASELAQAIASRVPGFDCRFEPDHRHEIAQEWPRSIDDSAARADWGWRPRHTLASMADHMLEALEARRVAGAL